MKKVSLLILVSLILLLAFTSCDVLPEGVVETLDNVKETVSGTFENVKNTVLGVFGIETHEHEWTDATCESPKTCECGETEGEPLGHTWVEATCTLPKYCSTCKTTEGEPIDHDWVEATCQAPKTCRSCGETEGRVIAHTWVNATCTTPRYCTTCREVQGEALGHDWAEATCAAPRTCKRCNISQGTSTGHIWAEADCETAKTCTGCGATEGEALGHKWVDATCSAAKTCSVCGKTEGEPLPHNYESVVTEVSCTTDGYTTNTCTVCGNVEITDVIEAEGHNFGSASCTEPATCSKCGFTSGVAIGHDFADATCQAPKTCKRCGATEGTTIDHVLTEATCTDPAYCINCDYVSDIWKTHSLISFYKDKILTYVCTACQTEFTIDTTDNKEGYYIDGTDHNGLFPVANSSRGYITHAEDSDLPVIKDGHYELILGETVDYKSRDDGGTDAQIGAGQLQLWIPNNSGGIKDFNSDNYATGFFSFKFNSNMDNPDNFFRMQFVDNSQGDTYDVDGDGTPESIRWQPEWCIAKNFFLVSSLKEDGTVDIMGFDGYVLKTIPVGEGNWTGWVDVKMGIELNPDDLLITVHYYIEGEYIESISEPLTTLTRGVSSVYITGSSISAGTGLMLDDIAFGYNNDMGGAWPYDYHVCKYEFLGCDKEAKCPVCGEIEGPAPGHKWVEATCTDPKTCSVCNLTEGEALGHELGDATCDQPASCSRPGCGFTSGTEALGHDWAEATCDAPKTCKRCGVSEGEPAGHTWTDATCTAPKTCSACGDTEGEPAGHTWTDATCTAPKTCSVCEETEGDPLGHSGGTATCTELAKCEVCGEGYGELLPHSGGQATCLERAVCAVCSQAYGEPSGHSLEVSTTGSITYTCVTCRKSYSLDKYYYFDGSSYNGMTGAGNSNGGYSCTTGDLPATVTEDGNTYYQLLNYLGSSTQYQLWIPHGGLFTDFANFSCANNAVGFISFKVNSYINDAARPFDLKIVDGRSTGIWDWSKSASPIFQITMPNADGVATVKGIGGITLKEVKVGEDKFTGWIDVKIAIQLNSDNTIAVYYYLDGEYVTKYTGKMPINTGAIGALYFSGYTAALNSGFKFDDLAFGFSYGKSWELGVCEHNWEEATCTTPKKCTLCGAADGAPLGHKGGTATCTELAECEVCGVEYGDYKHNANEATCGQASVCADCGVVVAPALPHATLTWSYADGVATYVCPDCNTEYKVDKNYHFDGTDSTYQNMVSVDENNIYNTVTAINPDGTEVDSGAPIINSDGQYEYINNMGAPEVDADGKPLYQGKATIWIPCMNGGIEDFEDFSCEKNAKGFYSFSINAYCDTTFEMQLVDTDLRIAENRPEGKDFWSSGAQPTFFKISAPDANGKVTVYGVDGTILTTITVGEDMFTGWFDVTVGIELTTDNKIILDYYIDGAYVKSVTKDLAIVSGKIDGVYFQIKAHTIGGGIKFDDVCFGYVSTPAAE